MKVARACLLSVGCTALAASLVAFAAAPDPRVRTVIYNADEIFRLVAYVGYQIDIEFEPAERFVGLGAGDVESVTFAVQANHLFLKPKAAAAHTNLTVLTNRRAYHFDYKTSTGAPDPTGADVLYVMRFLYADAATPQPSRPAESAPLRIETPADQPRNSNYWYCGREEVAPLSAWDDGVQTHLRFDPRRELPAVFVRNDDDSESLLNFHIANGELIAHRVVRRFIVRRGGLVGCIVNRGFVGSTLRPSSGTLTPEVERHTREAPDALAR